MTLIESVRNFISTCPYLPEVSKEINVNFLSKEVSAYSIEEVEEKAILKKYIDGSSNRQFVFELTGNGECSEDIIKNIANSAFYEHFSEWLEEQSLKKNLPIMEEDKEARKIETLANSYIFDVKENIAQFKIKCRLVYYKRGGN